MEQESFERLTGDECRLCMYRAELIVDRLMRQLETGTSRDVAIHIAFAQLATVVATVKRGAGALNAVAAIEQSTASPSVHRAAVGASK